MDDFSFLITCATRTHTHIYMKLYITSLSGSFTNPYSKCFMFLFPELQLVLITLSLFFFFFLIMSQNCQSLHLALDCELVKNKCVVGLKDRPPPPPSTHRYLVEVLLWFGFALLCNVASRSEVKGNVREEISTHTRTNAGPQSESIKTQSSEKR